jgi:hypothetical protein
MTKLYFLIIFSIFTGHANLAAAACLKENDQLTGTLDYSIATPTIHISGSPFGKDFMMASLLLDQPQCFLLDVNETPTDKQSEIQIWTINNLAGAALDRLLKISNGNIRTVKINNLHGPAHAHHKQEVIVNADAVAVVATNSKCKKSNFTDLLTKPKNSDDQKVIIKREGRTYFFSEPSDSCRSNIFIVKGDSATIIESSKMFTLVRYTSKEKIDYYGWIPKNAHP